ncbi:histone-lysine N-methyltransferase SETMAR [Plakobranchus ocellatus]|uniref:Histone-lysine N-methyltransferase SETMAR n=1 Tax=Plakobranchus ocellatus TaxID=259542 RepID=A0AAV3Z259_9GAST|nr:histone-lysine N-methyltransferase SETMAR [Plakobranchus ocellatus]
MHLQLVFLLFLGILIVSPAQGATYWKFKMDGHTYVVRKEVQPFDINKMNDICKTFNGYLLELNNKSEQAGVRKYLYRTRRFGYTVYTGFTDLGSEGKFYHINSKKPMPKLNWKWWNPDNWKNEEHCVNIGNRGVNDLRCNATGRYICEIDYYF